MQLDGQRVAVISVADRVAAAAYGFVKAAHMPANGNGFLCGKAHVTFDEVYTFFAVSKGELICHLVERDLFPLPSDVVLDVAGADLVIVR